MEGSLIYVVGHKSPDTDSVASAIAYANLKNILGQKNVVPAVAGDLNNETKHLLKLIGIKSPQKIEDISGKSVILVDHNEASQAVNGLDKADLVEVVDHHKIGGLQTSKPIFFYNEPVGATATIIAGLYDYYEIKVPKAMAALLMGAILSDTVLFKSPTCTLKDRDTVKKLSEAANLDPMKFGMELLKAKSDVKSKSAKELLMNDFKKFEFNGINAGVGQIEVMDIRDLEPRRSALLEEMKKLASLEKLDLVVLMLTDVMKEASDLLFVGNDKAKAGFEKAFGGKLTNNSIYREKILSRKKQVIPPLEEAFK